MKRIFILGSINLDLSITAERLPRLGESVRGSRFMQTQGGKGANQAVACARLGGEEVYIMGAVGRDEPGARLIWDLESAGVNAEGAVRKETSSGICMIVLDAERKDNILVVDTGANDKLRFEDFSDFFKSRARAGDILIAQLEVPLPTVRDTLRQARKKNMFTVLNPAPACALDSDVLKNVDLLVPNETEFALLTGETADNDASLLCGYRLLREKGAGNLLVTRGRAGSTYAGETFFTVPARSVQVVDTTAAGDTFIGALCVSLARDEGMEQAMRYATLCASVTVTRRGAAESIPTLAEINGISRLQ